MTTALHNTVNAVHLAQEALHQAVMLLSLATDLSEGNSWEPGSLAARVWEQRELVSACTNQVRAFATDLRQALSTLDAASHLVAEAMAASTNDPFADE